MISFFPMSQQLQRNLSYLKKLEKYVKEKESYENENTKLFEEVIIYLNSLKKKQIIFKKLNLILKNS